MTLYGGDVLAEPRPDGGWLVRARMPVDPPPPLAANGLTSPAAGHP